MKRTHLHLAQHFLFSAFFVSLLYELWRDYFVGALRSPSAILHISDNRTTTLHENAPTYAFMFALSLAVRQSTLWVHNLCAALTTVALIGDAVYKFDVFGARLASSPMPLIDCVHATLYPSFLATALFFILAEIGNVVIMSDRSAVVKRE